MKEFKKNIIVRFAGDRVSVIEHPDYYDYHGYLMNFLNH